MLGYRRQARALGTVAAGTVAARGRLDYKYSICQKRTSEESAQRSQRSGQEDDQCRNHDVSYKNPLANCSRGEPQFV